MNKTSKIIYFIISIIFFIAFDLFSSNAVYNNIEALPNNPILDLISVQNTGAAFSILQNSKIFLICFAITAIIAIAFYAIKQVRTFGLHSLYQAFFATCMKDFLLDM